MKHRTVNIDGVYRVVVETDSGNVEVLHLDWDELIRLQADINSMVAQEERKPRKKVEVAYPYSPQDIADAVASEESKI